MQHDAAFHLGLHRLPKYLECKGLVEIYNTGMLVDMVIGYFDKQCRLILETAKCSISSGSTLIGRIIRIFQGCEGQAENSVLRVRVWARDDE